MNDLLQKGITAYKAGKRDEARKFFITVIKQSPDSPESERAWGWMFESSGDDTERIFCLNKMLSINPNNEKAKQLLGKLLSPPLSPAPTLTENNTLNVKDNPMPDFTQREEPKPTPARPKYTELDFSSASNSLLSKIEAHLKSIRGMLQFFVLITILVIILQGCSMLLSL